ncbi:hypothetical protein SD70_01995 [Gordoniibacillus kamchatkensis]|uniref:Uncharacterized protein n=1 Tax=Gordoniibacillus kamchatkensis TaxID=1590651 RepID=A0ABR5AMS3_9BACL|nr:hypothetical protein [Paenibacillus sp. VKM B-2647]KIL42309.1 hypothetical protein SD70_01995 [Paenibacillus sp. VKM B-2647]
MPTYDFQVNSVDGMPVELPAFRVNAQCACNSRIQNDDEPHDKEPAVESLPQMLQARRSRLAPSFGW